MARLPRPRFGRARRPAPPRQAPEPPTGEQAIPGQGLDGIRAWLAQLERELRTRSRIAAGAVIVALAASGVAIYFALDSPDDAATKSELNEVRTKITTVEQSALRAAADDVAAFGGEINRLEQMIRSQAGTAKRNRSELGVVTDDIDDLRRQISDLSDQLADLESEIAANAGQQGSGGRSGA